MPDTAVDAFLVEVEPGTSSRLLVAELRQPGGACPDHTQRRSPRPAGGDFVLSGVGVAPTPDIAAGARIDNERLVDPSHPP